MKLIVTSVVALTLATSAFANGKSDRYNDQRLDTAVGHVDSFAQSRATAKKVTPTAPRAATLRISTRNNATAQAPRGYAYANPYGVGPNNDSR